jgi:hypothetical protein
MFLTDPSRSIDIITLMLRVGANPGVLHTFNGGRYNTLSALCLRYLPTSDSVAYSTHCNWVIRVAALLLASGKVDVHADDGLVLMAACAGRNLTLVKVWIEFGVRPRDRLGRTIQLFLQYPIAPTVEDSAHALTIIGTLIEASTQDEKSEALCFVIRQSIVSLAEYQDAWSYQQRAMLEGDAVVNLSLLFHRKRSSDGLDSSTDYESVVFGDGRLSLKVVAEVLLQNGADPNFRDSEPLRLSFANSRLDLAFLLLSWGAVFNQMVQTAYFESLANISSRTAATVFSVEDQPRRCSGVLLQSTWSLFVSEMMLQYGVISQRLLLHTDDWLQRN